MRTARGLPSVGGGGDSIYPPSDRRVGTADFADSSTHLAPHDDAYGLDQYYNEHEKEHADGGAQRSSGYSAGLAYDSEQPTTPHRRTGSGAYKNGEEDFQLQQQQHLDYNQQWPGYGRDQYGREVYPSQQKGNNAHARQKSG